MANQHQALLRRLNPHGRTPLLANTQHWRHEPRSQGGDAARCISTQTSTTQIVDKSGVNCTQIWARNGREWRWVIAVTTIGYGNWEYEGTRHLQRLAALMRCGIWEVLFFWILSDTKMRTIPPNDYFLLTITYFALSVHTTRYFCLSDHPLYTSAV
jgi:hypothetical protein